ncbi:MAG TPA: hypothetical protein V6D02_12540, partial [Candidatus Obscuribacterales bacterium]
MRSDGLRDIERVVLEGSWHRYTYQKIASEAGYTEGYLSRDVGPALWSVLSDALGMQVKKTNFRTAIERWSKDYDAPPEVPPALADRNGQPPVTAPVPELDPLPIDVADFRGREAELADLTAWVVDDRGRLLCLAGVPGVGKTWLALKLAAAVRSQFQQWLYRDLRDRPTPLALVSDLLDRLHISLAPTATLREGVDVLLKTLGQYRCLIVLDGCEIFGHPTGLAGTYGPAFEGYSQLLEALASRDHHSCVLWVGREWPKTAAPLTGSSCRFQGVAGLSPEALSTLAAWPDEMAATAADWQHLSNHYGGVPALILTEIAPRLASFSYDLGACLAALQRDRSLLRGYIDTWLAPLAEVEWRILTWLMISRQPLSLLQLSECLEVAMPLNAIESLCDRGVCRSVVNGTPRWELTLPDLLHAYLCDRWLTAFRAAPETERLQLLHQYPLLQAAAPEMVRQWQRQTLLAGVAAALATAFPHPAERQEFLRRLGASSHALSEGTAPSGYSAGNLMNLAQYWQLSPVGLDFQGLKLREADLQSDLCQGVSFAGADLSQTLLAKPLGPCPVIAIHPHQPQVAVGDQDGRLLLWQRHDGRLQRAMLSVPEAIRAIAFSPDGHTLAEGRSDGTIRLWDLRSEYGPELFATLPEGALTTLTFSPDKTWLLGGDDRGYLYGWRLASGEERYRLPAHDGSMTAIAVSPLSDGLLTCGQDCTAVEWDLATGTARHRFQGRLTNLLGTVAYLPGPADNPVRRVVIGQDDEQLVIWDIVTARPMRTVNKSGDLFMALALSADGRYLAASDVSNRISVWDVDSKSLLYEISEATAPVEALVFSPDSQALLSGCDYTVQCWQVRTGQCLRRWGSDRHPAHKLALATHPLQLLSSHDDNTLRGWQLAAPRQRWLPQARLTIPEGHSVSVLATSAGGEHWAIGTEEGHIHLWHCQSQTWLVWSMRLPAPITALAWSAEGRLLAAGDATGTVALWDVPDRLFRWQKNQTHSDQVMALAFAPNGQQVFSGSRDRTIQGWDLVGNAMPPLLGHRRRVHTLWVAADNRTLYSG